MAALAVARIESLREVDALQPEWEALAAGASGATAFQSFAWCRAWLAVAAARAPGRIRPGIVTVREEGRLVMLWPLQQERIAGLRLLGWIGEPMTQYGDVLAAPGEGRERWRAAAEDALRGWRTDLIHLKRQRCDGVLAGCGEAPGWTMRDGESAPYLTLDGAARSTITAQERSQRRRARRLERLGTVDFLASAQADERAALTRDALRLKGEWLKARRLVSSGLSHPLTLPFLERLAREGAIEVSALKVGGAVAAVEIGLGDAAAYRSLITAYDLRFAEGAPGHALTVRAVGAAQARGEQSFDFLAPADPAKARWASGEVRLRTSSLPLTLRGHCGLFAYRMRPFAKRAVLAALRLAGRLRDAGGAVGQLRPSLGLQPQTVR